MVKGCWAGGEGGAAPVALLRRSSGGVEVEGEGRKTVLARVGRGSGEGLGKKARKGRRKEGKRGESCAMTF